MQKICFQHGHQNVVECLSGSGTGCLQNKASGTQDLTQMNHESQHVSKFTSEERQGKMQKVPKHQARQNRCLWLLPCFPLLRPASSRCLTVASQNNPFVSVKPFHTFLLVTCAFHIDTYYNSCSSSWCNITDTNPIYMTSSRRVNQTSGAEKCSMCSPAGMR